MEYLWCLPLAAMVVLIIMLIILVIKMKHFNVRLSAFESKLALSIKAYQDAKDKKRAAYASLKRNFKDALKIYSLYQLIKYFLKKDKRKKNRVISTYLVGQKYINRLIG